MKPWYKFLSWLRLEICFALDEKISAYLWRKGWYH